MSLKWHNHQLLVVVPWWRFKPFYPHLKKHLQKASAFSVMIALRQVMSDEMLRIVMIGFAKFKKQRQSYLNICASKSITREALITLNLPPSEARQVQFVLLPAPNKNRSFCSFFVFRIFPPLSSWKRPLKKTFPHLVDTVFLVCYTWLIKMKKGEIWWKNLLPLRCAW